MSAEIAFVFSIRKLTRWVAAFCILLATANAMGQELGRWPDPIRHDVIAYHTSGLTHGPMLGRPTADSIRVWVRTQSPTSFRVVYSQSTPLTVEGPNSIEGVTTAEHDHAGVVQIRGLRPNTRYYYGIVTDKGLVDTRMEFDRPWPSFRTMPSGENYRDAENNPNKWFNFQFSIGCCARQLLPKFERNIYASPPSFLNLYKNHRDDLAFHIVNGDFMYEETLNGARSGFENNYKLYLDRGRNMANLFRYVPFIGMFNDHEMNSNLDGAGEIGLPHGDYLKRDPAIDVWRDYVGWTNDPSPHRDAIRFGRCRMQEGDDVLVDENADFRRLDPARVSTIHVGPYMQGDGKTKAERGGANAGVYGLVEVIDEHRIRVRPPFRTTSQGNYSIGTHHFFDRKVGNCHFLFLDTRSERSRWRGVAHSHDKDRFILGDVQRRWLVETAKKSDASFLFVISPDPWVIYHSAYHVKPEGGTKSKGDGFCGYVHEREQILKELNAIPKPVLLFTGDVHNSAAVQVTDNVWEFMCGPLNSAGHPIGTLGLPPFGGWFDSEGRKVKVKWLAGFPDNVHFSRQRNTYYTVVRVNNVMVASKPSGRGYQFIPYDEPQVIVQYYDGYTGKLVYAESVSTIDAKPEGPPAGKKSRWPAVRAKPDR